MHWSVSTAYYNEIPLEVAQDKMIDVYPKLPGEERSNRTESFAACRFMMDQLKYLSVYQFANTIYLYTYFINFISICQHHTSLCS